MFNDNKETGAHTENYKQRAIRNKKGLDYADELRLQGHRCIRYVESYPVEVHWCQCTPCKNRKRT